MTKEETLSALRKYLVPLFDTSKAVLVVVAPLNQVEKVSAALGAAVVMEDALDAAFPQICTAVTTAAVAAGGAGDAAGAPAAAKARPPPPRAGGGGGAAAKPKFGWANVGACECPKCEIPPQPE